MEIKDHCIKNMKEKNQNHKKQIHKLIIVTCLLITMASAFRAFSISRISYDTINVELRYNKKIVNDFSKVSIYIVLKDSINTKDSLMLKQIKNIFLAPLNSFNKEIQADCYVRILIKEKKYTLKVPFSWLKSLVWKIEIEDYNWCKRRKYKVNYGYSFRASGFGVAG